MLKIKIIGTEGIKQKALVKRLKQAIEALNSDVQIVEITNLEEIMAFDIIQTPALVVRNQVLSQGIIPQIAELKTLISAFLPPLKNVESLALKAN